MLMFEIFQVKQCDTKSLVLFCKYSFPLCISKAKFILLKMCSFQYNRTLVV